MTAASAVLLASVALTGAAHHPVNCPKHFTVPMARRAIFWTYRGRRDVSRREAREVRNVIRCQWDTRHRPMLRRELRREIHRWHQRRRYGPWQWTVVSYYDDSTIAYRRKLYGFAACGTGLCVPWGTRVEFKRDGRAVIGKRDDSGPYIPGRGFDVNENMARVLGLFGVGVAPVRYRILRR